MRLGAIIIRLGEQPRPNRLLTALSNPPPPCATRENEVEKRENVT